MVLLLLRAQIINDIGAKKNTASDSRKQALTPWIVNFHKQSRTQDFSDSKSFPSFLSV